MKQMLLLILITMGSSAHALNCLSTDIDGPQDGEDLYRCSEVLVPGTDRVINCLSEEEDGPQDGAELALCMNQ